MQYILEQIQTIDDNPDSHYSPVDFILLQEADWLAKPYPISHRHYAQTLTGFINYFNNELTRLGWRLIIPARNLQVHGFMVMLYNANVLQPTGRQQGIFPSKHYLGQPNNYFRNTGHEVIFTHRPTRRLIAITNIHFDADLNPDPTQRSNYSQQVLDHQFTRRNQGILTIIGGDTNHAQHIDQIGLIGARNYATQFGGLDLDHGSLRTRRTPTAEYPMQYPKRYDGFFASPGSRNTRITATELKGMFFSKRVRGAVRIFANYLDPIVTYQESIQRRGQMGEDSHVHTNGYYFNRVFGFNITFGWPYIPGRIKLFLVRMLNRAPTDPLILTRAGAPDIDYCNQNYPAQREEAIQDFRDINETYYEAKQQFEEQRRTNPELNPKESEVIYERLHRERLERNQQAHRTELLRMYRRNLADINRRQAELRQAEQAQRDQAEGWMAVTRRRRR